MMSTVMHPSLTAPQPELAPGRSDTLTREAKGLPARLGQGAPLHPAAVLAHAADEERGGGPARDWAGTCTCNPSQGANRQCYARGTVRSGFEGRACPRPSR